MIRFKRFEVGLVNVPTSIGASARERGFQMSILTFLGEDAHYRSRTSRPIYEYDYDPKDVGQLASELGRRLQRGIQDDFTAEAFVLWAVERIHSDYQQGALTWKFVFDGLGLAEDGNLARDLALRGLARFKRKVRRSDNGRTLYLFTLLAEGGVPEAMLRGGNSVYRRVVLGLLNEIEREGGVELDAAVAEQIAERRAVYLPDVFHNREAARTLARLALALAALRQALPEGLPAAAAVSWLDANRPQWRRELPLRLSEAALEALVKPALEMSRAVGPGGAPVATRELRQGANGEWLSFLRLEKTGWLDGGTVLTARGRNLRLIGSGAAAEATVPFYGAWETSGWTLSRPGPGELLTPLPLDAPFGLKVYADGIAFGETAVEPGLPAACEAPTFWRPADGQSVADCERLTPLSGRPKTSASSVWLLASRDARVIVETGLSTLAVQLGPEGNLWPLVGQGLVHVDDQVFEVGTGAEAGEKRYVLEPVGPALPGWRTLSGGPVFVGRPAIRGGFTGMGSLRALRDDELVRKAAFGLGAEFVAWVERGEMVARVKTISLPGEAEIDARETAAGELKLRACGLGKGWRLAVQAGNEAVNIPLMGGAAEVTLPPPKTPQATIALTMSDPASGRTLDLVAPWPARRGMLLSPAGERLDRDIALCIDELMGWRAIAPTAGAKVYLRALGGGDIAIGIDDEFPLTLLAPRMRSMLALGGPDAQVNLSLVVQGFESRRLQIRRYGQASYLQGDRLSVGLSPEGDGRGGAKLLDGQLDVHLHGVEIENGAGCEKQLVARDLNLRDLLGEMGGLWIVLARVNGRVQRPVAWSPRPFRNSTRADRISGYAEEWKQLAGDADPAVWKEPWSAIEKVQRYADVGCLDRVQALAVVPRALVKQAYLVGPEQLSDHLGLDLAAPFLWPAIPVDEFVEGLRGAAFHLTSLLASLGDEARIREFVGGQIVLRSQAIMALRPDLSAHIGHGLSVLRLLDYLPLQEQFAILSKFAARPNALEAIQKLAQSAAQKPVALPSGIADLYPWKRPPRLEFDAERQRLVDAPLIAAEAALGRRPGLTTNEMLALVLLRMCDVDFFDRAVAAAIQLALEERQ